MNKIINKITDNIVVPSLEAIYQLLPHKNTSYCTSNVPKIIAHRGNTQCKEYLENTIPAFRNAIQLGADGIECDVHLTADEEIIISHDRSLERVFNVPLIVNRSTLAMIKQKVSTVPTFMELIDTFKSTNALLFVEIKHQLDKKMDEILCNRIVNYIYKHQLTDRCYILSSEFDILKNYINHPSKLIIVPIAGYSRKKALNFVLQNKLNGLSGHFVPFSNKFMTKLKANNILSGIGIVNNKDVAIKSLRKNVDFIFSDVPEVVLHELQQNIVTI